MGHKKLDMTEQLSLTHYLFLKVFKNDTTICLLVCLLRLKCLPPMREMQVQSLGWKDLLEKEMATHSSMLAWRIPWSEEPGRLQSMGSQKVGHD